VRRTVLLVLVFGLGVLAAVATSCGQGGVHGGIPSSRAADLKRQIGDVQEFVDRGDCGELTGQLRQVDQEIDNLPASVSDRLVANLREGADRLRQTAVQACNERTQTSTQTTETTPTVITETVPTETTTVPTTTTTTPTTTTPTTPTTTTPTTGTPTTPGTTTPSDNGGAVGPDQGTTP
jgi:hypothetical protein